MAQPPNNFFATNIVTIPGPVSTPTGSPLVITINPFAEGITDYTLSCAILGSYVTYFNIVGPTTGGTFTFYVPSVAGLLGQTITVKNTSDDDVNIVPSTNALIDEGAYASILLVSPSTAVPGDLGAATLMANPTNADSWYVTNTFAQI
jgi:hypothetical protein